ncbi:inhibitor of Bruton tyrosine kinase-like [Physella acuta]|uniref:inhibitor of Bruton tyrosine kinase-like n=1 Tax=Physella acuta TaxID=109671 RepID=UPI0027DB218E|nr:inhibitor of Bruton tyrosine kinase-like [Physella acuta]
MAPTLLEKQCCAKCRSRAHVYEIISLVMCPNITLKEFQVYSSLCHNWAKHTDFYGRSALHLAASCGKTEILEWLLEEKKLDMMVKDFESGFTALHRAIFYGQLTCTRMLLQYNCDTHVRDYESLTPLDIAMMDRPPHVTFTLKEPSEVYTWGENNNSTLGHPSPHKRTSPEAVEVFKKSGVSLKQIVLCKYHSVFLSQSGHVYTCGHGQGGRLGHTDQHTVLVPRLLDSVKEYTCLEVAAATDHTVLRMGGGFVYTFGLNTYHQLGLMPHADTCPEPRQMNLKPLKGKSISGVCVGRFHTVVWTPDSVFTVGLNAGQLGHQRGEHYQSTLRQVSSLRHTDIGIARVACSDAATVCLTTKGDVYVLHEYQCKKIASKWQDIEQVLVTGGNLDHSTGLGLLTEKGGQELLVMLKNEPGQLFLWRNSSPSLKRCQFGFKRQLWVSDVAMTTSSIIFCTKRGEAFIGQLSNRKPGRELESKHTKELVKDCGDGFNQPRLLDLLLRDEAEEVSIHRVPVVHRAVMVAVDRKARNFTVVQPLPNGCLTELPSVNTSEISEHFRRLYCDADVEDNIHDAVIQVGEKSWPVHKYIISLRSDYFRNLIASNTCVTGEKPRLKVDNVSVEIMEQIISFIYTDTCDYLQPGHKVLTKPTAKDKLDPSKVEPVSLIQTKGMSAFQVNQKLNKGAKKSAQSESKEELQVSNNPVKLLQDAARKFGVKGLSKRLEAVKCVNNVIISQGKTMAKPRVKFDRSKLPELCDVSINTEDGEEIECHKCVLVARLEYFYSMLSTGWVETFNTTNLTLPVPGQVLGILLDYLYSDEVPQLRDCCDEELLCSLLIVSDQLLASRLKEMCEVALANTLAFKNVGELLEFSTIYNAQQLRLSCQQFISLNLAAILEGRYLDVLSQETMDDLTVYYRSIIPNMAYRVMTPEDDGPTKTYLDDLVKEYDSLDGDILQVTPQGSAKKSKQVKKRAKAKKMFSEDVDKINGSAQSGASVAKPSPAVCERLDKEVHSVLEDLDRQAKEDDKKLVAQAKSKDKIKWRPAELADIPVVKPTQPEDVPHWQPSFKTLVKTPPRLESVSLVPDRPLTSPVMPASPTSLRDIMLQESQTADKTKSSFSSRVSWKDVKKQQNKKSKESPTSEPTSAPIVSPKAAATNPWASISSASQSLRDVMIQEEKFVSSPIAIPQPGATRNKSSAPIAIPQSEAGVPRTRASNSISGASSLGSYGKSPPSGSVKSVQSFGSGGENPWQHRIASSPPSLPPLPAINFSAILKDEKEKSETLVRTQKKPLALIQLEEQAMNELLTHYKADQEMDRYITVERVSKAIAAPLWNRDPKSPGSGVL